MGLLTKVLSEPLRRDWRIFEGCDVDAGRDAGEVGVVELSACKAHCERYGLGGFVVHEGTAYFRRDAAESLDRRRASSPGCVLHLGFVWQARQSQAAVLHDEDGMPAIVGESTGLWLDEEDFIIGTTKGQTVGLQTVTSLGIHGFPRNWPSVVSESTALKNLLKTRGPCAATRVMQVTRPSAELQRRVEGLPLWPLQSFENALSVQAHTRMGIVKGWAVYELFGVADSVFVAESYWWNVDSEGRWLDFSPRPASMPDLLLVESSASCVRSEGLLTHEQLSLAEGLLCLRFPGIAAVSSVELGTGGAISVALAHVRSAGSLAREMVNAGMCTALVEHLSVHENMSASVQLLAVLAECLQEKGLNEEVLSSLFSTDIIWPLVRILSEATESALAAASALAHLCRRSAEAKQHALRADAAQALAELFSRGDVSDPQHARVAARAQSHWEQMNDTARTDQASPPNWSALQVRCLGELEVQHKHELPLLRRGRSWGRVLAFARVALGAYGANVRRGTAEWPFTIWVLCAEDMVEAYLAEEGYFDDANWVDRAPTEIILASKQHLRELSPGHVLPREGGPVVVRTASYEALAWRRRLGSPLPDFLAVLTPEAHAEGIEVPEKTLADMPQVPIVVSTRCHLDESGAIHLRHKIGSTRLILPLTRCPFSSGSAAAKHEDNAMLLAVKGSRALCAVLDSLAARTDALLSEGPQPGPQPGARTRCLFWGILDIKYDTSRPLLERVKVLETGNGETSKFSGAGRVLKTSFEEHYHSLPSRDADLQMYRLVSADKKWTHDRMEHIGYGHLVPKQAWYPRKFAPDLAERICDDLDIRDGDHVVLKLCNRSRAAGVVVVPSEELDEVLEDLLVPPADLEFWFDQGLEQMKESPVEVGCQYRSFTEQQRHWWSNESPVFVAERFCASVPLVMEDGRAVDATLRVAFVLRPGGDMVDWLGGYWKLSSSDGDLRERFVSAARTEGTECVNPAIVHDVYTALDDAVQGLFNEEEPNAEALVERYSDEPRLAAYLIARLGASHRTKNALKARELLQKADEVLSEVGRDNSDLSKASMLQAYRGCVHSYILRTEAVLEATSDTWLQQEPLFMRSLHLMPTNATSLMFLGLSILENRERLQEAVDTLSCSLLLDPDSKATYVNLGAAYLRLGQYEKARVVSEAGLKRFEDTPQCYYHMGVACCQLLLGSAPDAQSEERQEEALEALQRARDHDRALSRTKNESPNLEVDEQMLAFLCGEAEHTDVMALPENVGWLLKSVRAF